VCVQLREGQLGTELSLQVHTENGTARGECMQKLLTLAAHVRSEGYSSCSVHLSLSVRRLFWQYAQTKDTIGLSVKYEAKLIKREVFFKMSGSKFRALYTYLSKNSYFAYMLCMHYMEPYPTGTMVISIIAHA